ncbi:MAG TPA: helix-turn-helix domain-containing protein [Candidatus Mediterraneibacter excrementavium]|nr:helix-turn-helix domain-containing protein [Candidatus Mediterraneibacter excrementavium]
MDNRIRELRNERGLRQEDLAEIINVSQQTISRLENGENSLPADILVDLSKYFRVSADYILKLSDARMTREYRIEADRYIENQMDLFRTYERLSKANKCLIRRIMICMEESEQKRE